MRAGRLVNLLLLLERRGRMTAAELATELEVSTRTVLRDIDALSGAGVPVYSVRGPAGGFELLEGYSSKLGSPTTWTHGSTVTGGRRSSRRRARIRVSPEGRRLAAVLGRLQPLRIRDTTTDEHGWLIGTFRISSIERSALDVLSLGPEAEVLDPTELRALVSELSAATSDLYRADGNRVADAGQESG